jgi:hypothetical protein
MDEWKASGKTVQQMTASGAMETDKATGEVKSISAQEMDTGVPDIIEKPIGRMATRVSAEAQVGMKKKAVRKANEQVRARFREEPLSKTESRLSFDEKKPSGKLKDAAARPGREVLLAAHRQTDRDGADNSGVAAAHFTERGAEKTGGAVNTAVRKQAQKRHIKKEYAKTVRQGGKGVKNTAATAKKAAAKAKEASQKQPPLRGGTGKVLGLF